MNSHVVEFLANGSERVIFNGIALAEPSRYILASMVVQGVKEKLDQNQGVTFQELCVSFGFNQNGAA